MKILTLILYLSVNSMEATGGILGVTGQSIMRWSKLFGYTCKEDAQCGKIEEESETDGMLHFIGRKLLLCIWKIPGHISGQLFAWECGDSRTVSLERLKKRAGLHQAKRVYMHNYKAYGGMIGVRSLRQGKQNMYKLEQNNGTQRHWLRRVHGKSIVVSKSEEMVDLF